MAVKRSFSSAIVYSRRLSKGKVDLMVLFMVDNHCDLFKVSGPMKRQLNTKDSFEPLTENVDHPFFVPIFPKQIPVSLHKLVSDRIMSIMKGNDPNVTAGLPIVLSLHVAFVFAVALAAVPLKVPGNSPVLCLYAGSAYCTRVTAKAYSENAQKCTKEELWSLLRTIHESPKLAAKEKRRLLEQFYKGHPEIFVQYFGNRLSTINMLLQ